VDQRQPRGQGGEGPIGPPRIRDTKLKGVTIRLIPISERFPTCVRGRVVQVGRTPGKTIIQIAQKATGGR
jgi:hypothetical protein